MNESAPEPREEKPAESAPEISTGAAARASTAPSNESQEDRRAREKGLPLDSGPEETVLRVRRCLWRARPATSLLLWALPFAVLWFTYFVQDPNPKFWFAAQVFVVSALIFWGAYGVWWFVTAFTESLEITNKRTVMRKGLFARATNEVLHDHVRNIRVTQSVPDRVFRVGAVGISSSGQDEIEIEMRDLPNPDRVREIIDVYRPL